MNRTFQKLIVDVRVQDLPRAMDFYKNVLGLPLIQRASEWASFEVNGAEIHLYLHGGTSTGIEFRVTNIEDAVKRMKAKDIQFTINQKEQNLLKVTGEVMEFPWGKAAYFKDSEGNNLALVQDRKRVY